MNIKELPFYIYAEYTKDGKTKEVHIRTGGIGGQDCQIGDFAENWYIRPAKAVKCLEYKTLGDYKRAIKLSMKRAGMIVTKIYQKIDVDGVEYIKEL
jgi:hypothetical protein